MPHKQLVVAVTGASGAVYGRRLLEHLLAYDVRVHLIISPHGQAVIEHELPAKDLLDGLPASDDLLISHNWGQMTSSLASGSFAAVYSGGMIVCPCSLNTLAGVAAGRSDNLILRAAQVHLKERRPVILAVREMPFGTIDLSNMLAVSQAGGVICPLSPPFYHRPESLGDLIDAAVAKILNLLDIEHQIDLKWSPQGAD